MPLAYGEAPRLQPDRLVILDNLGAHKIDGVRQRIESGGAALLYLPPGSPDFNPPSKLKRRPREIKAWLLDKLDPAPAAALAASTPQGARAFFTTAATGYGTY